MVILLDKWECRLSCGGNMGLDSTSSCEDIVALVVARVGNCYEKHDLCCSEAVMYVLGQAFASDLSARDAVLLGAGFCHGMGGAGCTCGALTGAVALLSYYLGPQSDGGVKKKKFRRCIKEMHDMFCERFRSTCCRDLLKKVKGEKGACRVSCQTFTEAGAEIATSLLLKIRPELLDVVDLDFLRSRQVTV